MKNTKLLYLFFFRNLCHFLKSILKIKFIRNFNNYWQQRGKNISLKYFSPLWDISKVVGSKDLKITISYSMERNWPCCQLWFHWNKFCIIIILHRRFSYIQWQKEGKNWVTRNKGILVWRQTVNLLVFHDKIDSKKEQIKMQFKIHSFFL